MSAGIKYRNKNFLKVQSNENHHITIYSKKRTKWMNLCRRLQAYGGIRWQFDVAYIIKIVYSNE